VAFDDLSEHVGEIERIDTAELAGFDERGDDGPVFSVAVRGDVMMPGVWAVRLSSPIRSARYSGSPPLLSPIRCMAALVM
jgi:hypothetical protein